MSLRGAMGVIACLLLATVALAGCGGGAGPSTSLRRPLPSQPAPPKSEFPSATGKTLAEVMKEAEPAELIVSPAATVFYRGENRYPFEVLDREHRVVTDAQVALYLANAPRVRKHRGGTARGPMAEARARALNQPAIGPFPAAIESLATKPAFRSQTTIDASAPPVVYVTKADFTGNGEWRIAALVKQGEKLTATMLQGPRVGEFKRVPRVGQRAPLIHTPTAADVGGDLAKITTRVPPDTQNRVDYANVLGKKPIVLLFATPKFCQSRVCGPVVDVAEQVKHEYGDRAAFIHMEIYNENDPSKGVRPQVRAFHLPTEPWLFVIDRRGVIRTEIEGAFGVDRLIQAVKGVTGG